VRWAHPLHRCGGARFYAGASQGLLGPTAPAGEPADIPPPRGRPACCGCECAGGRQIGKNQVASASNRRLRPAGSAALEVVSDRPWFLAGRSSKGLFCSSA